MDLPTHSSAAVAKSAAYVVSQPLTVQDFVARGAAIGIQMRQAPRKGQEPTTVPWDDSAKLLLYKVCAEMPISPHVLSRSMAVE